MQSTVWSASLDSCLSKSNMASVITIAGVEVTVHIARNCFVERREAGVISRATQIIDPCLREILILAADRLRHFNIFDIGRHPKRLEHGGNHVAEAFRPASAD